MDFFLKAVGSVGLTLLGFVAIETCARPILEKGRAKLQDKAIEKAKTRADGKGVMVIDNSVDGAVPGEGKVLYANAPTALSILTTCQRDEFGACVISREDMRRQGLDTKIPNRVVVVLYNKDENNG